jgi:hypothetical protein
MSRTKLKSTETREALRAERHAEIRQAKRERRKSLEDYVTKRDEQRRRRETDRKIADVLSGTAVRDVIEKARQEGVSPGAALQQFVRERVPEANIRVRDNEEEPIKLQQPNPPPDPAFVTPPELMCAAVAPDTPRDDHATPAESHEQRE